MIFSPLPSQRRDLRTRLALFLEANAKDQTPNREQRRVGRRKRHVDTYWLSLQIFHFSVFKQNQLTSESANLLLMIIYFGRERERE